MKIGDVVTQRSTNGNIVYQLQILELGKVKTKVLVLDSRVDSLVGREERWLAFLLKELWEQENY